MVAAAGAAPPGAGPPAARPARGDVFLVALDPTLGSEVQKTRPCLVVSPDELNRHLRTVIVAPMTTGGQPDLWRVSCRFRGRDGRVALEQPRTVDRTRLVRREGALARAEVAAAPAKLGELFAP